MRQRIALVFELLQRYRAGDPLLEVPDLKKTADIAHKHGLLFYVDNTFAKTSHRAYTKEQLDEAGITYGQLRFSVGLEDADDIIAEIDAALEKI